MMNCALIKEVVCARFGIGPDELRWRFHYSYERRLCWTLARTHTRRTIREIGMLIGGFGATAVHNGIIRYEAQRLRDKGAEEDFQALSQILLKRAPVDTRHDRLDKSAAWPIGDELTTAISSSLAAWRHFDNRTFTTEEQRARVALANSMKQLQTQFERISK